MPCTDFPFAEINTVLYKSVPAIPHNAIPDQRTEPPCALTLGSRAREAIELYGVWSFFLEVRQALHYDLHLSYLNTRKLLLLFNWLTPLTAIMAQQSVPFSSELSSEKSKSTLKPFLHTVMHAPPPVLLELVHALSDDMATMGLLGLLSKRTGERAGKFSDWCWFIATLVGLVENGVERQMIGTLQHDGM
jgi:hypothetical protein